MVQHRPLGGCSLWVVHRPLPVLEVCTVLAAVGCTFLVLEGVGCMSLPVARSFLEANLAECTFLEIDEFRLKMKTKALGHSLE